MPNGISPLGYFCQRLIILWFILYIFLASSREKLLSILCYQIARYRYPEISYVTRRNKDIWWCVGMVGSGETCEGVKEWRNSKRGDGKSFEKLGGEEARNRHQPPNKYVASLLPYLMARGWVGQAESWRESSSYSGLHRDEKQGHITQP